MSVPRLSAEMMTNRKKKQKKNNYSYCTSLMILNTKGNNHDIALVKKKVLGKRIMYLFGSVSSLNVNSSLKQPVITYLSNLQVNIVMTHK